MPTLYFMTHALVGAALGSAIGSRSGAIAAGLVSHLILDVIPHHDAAGPRGAVMDVATGTLVLILLRGVMDGPAWWGALAGALPDLEVVLRHYRVIQPSPWGFPSHNWRCLHHRWPPPGGVLLQVPFLLFAVLSLLYR